MSVHMFRARLSRMHGDDSSKPSADMLDILLAPPRIDDHTASTTQRVSTAGNHKETSAPVADARGILTHVVHQTQTVAGVFSGVGDFVSAIMSQSPPPKPSSDCKSDGDAADEAGMRTARLRYFRLDETDKLIEEDYDNLPGSARPDWALATAKCDDSLRAPLDVYWIF